MEKYDLTFILPEEDKDKIKEVCKPISIKLKSLGGNAIATHCQGIKTLAYPLSLTTPTGTKTYKKGIFCQVAIEIPTKNLSLFSNHLEQNPRILRYLLVLDKNTA